MCSIVDPPQTLKTQDSLTGVHGPMRDEKKDQLLSCSLLNSNFSNKTDDVLFPVDCPKWKCYIPSAVPEHVPTIRPASDIHRMLQAVTF